MKQFIGCASTFKFVAIHEDNQARRVIIGIFHMARIDTRSNSYIAGVETSDYWGRIAVI